MDFCTTHTLENDMNSTKLFDLTTTDGAALSLALRAIPVALLLAALFS